MVPKKYFEFLQKMQNVSEQGSQLYMQQKSCTSKDRAHLNNTKIGFRLIFNEECLTQFNIQNEVEKFIQKQAKHQIKSETDYEHYFIDFRQISLQRKNKLVQRGRFHLEDTLAKNFTQDAFVNLVYEIYERIGKSIKDYPLLMKIIDQHYIKTKKIFLIKITLYFFFYFIPLLIQFFSNTTSSIYTSLITCMSMQIGLQYLETKQMKLEGMDYFFDIWNILDVANFLVNCMFWTYRVSQLGQVKRIVIENVYEGKILNLRSMSSEEMAEMVTRQGQEIDPFLCILSVVLIFLSFMKVMFFLQAQENFGKISVLVQLVSYCVKDIMPVMVFMLFWITFFCFVQSFLGVQVDDSDYKDITYMYMVFLQTWRISIGDIIVPNHNYWINDMYSEKTQQAMVSLIWTFWFLNHFIILIILLNVLIAILSDSFELAMSQ